jgi:hypothetical protein
MGDFHQNAEDQLWFLGVVQGRIARKEVFNDFASMWGYGNDKRVGDEHCQSLGIQTEFVIPRLADEEEDIVVDMLYTGELEFV